MGCPNLLPPNTGQPSVESLFVSNLMHLSINPTNCMMIMPLKFDINVETKVNLQLWQYVLSLRPLIFFLINNLSSYLVLKEATFLVTSSSTISSGFTGSLPENTVNMLT